MKKAASNVVKSKQFVVSLHMYVSFFIRFVEGLLGAIIVLGIIRWRRHDYSRGDSRTIRM
jgi:hypothetical protein